MIINKINIQKVIPHRGNMLLIDEIRDFNGTSGIGIHYVRDDEFWCDGHFPGNKIMPGVLQIEAMAQTSCYIALISLGLTDGETLGYFTTIEKAKFINMVRPGDVLELHVELMMSKLRLYKFKGVAMVGDKKVSEAVFTAIMDSDSAEALN